MRLIDADELKKALAEMWYESAISITGVSISELIDNAPTIVPSGNTKSCGVSADKSTDQNVADVPSGDEYVPNKACFDCMERGTGFCKGTIQEQSWCPIVAKTNTVPSGDLISRKDAIEVVMAEGRNVHASEYANAERIIHEADAVEALSILPSADRPTDKSCRDCPIYSADRPQVNSNSAEEQIAETCDRPKGEWIHDGQNFKGGLD